MANISQFHQPMSFSLNQGKQYEYLIEIIKKNWLKHLLTQKENGINVDKGDLKSYACYNNETTISWR